MRAVVCDRYGPPDVLRLEEVAKPTPEPDEVLVRVHATTVNRTDCGIRAGEPLVSRLISGLRRPKWRILGTELAGTVEATGAAVTQFDAVGMLSFGRCKGSLKPGGAYLATDHLQNVPLALWTSRFGDFRVVFPIPPRYTKRDVLFLRQLIEEGSTAQSSTGAIRWRT
jgi:NADPH:quinone reductase-like Zn-dependent oxidoreductase